MSQAVIGIERQPDGVAVHDSTFTVTIVDRVVIATHPAQTSWNYEMTSCTASDSSPVVNYWMNRLPGRVSPKEHLVTLNATTRVNPTEVPATTNYEDPIYTAKSVAAQSKLAASATEHTVYAGLSGWMT